MSPEEFQLSDMILWWVFLAVPFAAAFGLGRLLERFRTRDQKNRKDRTERLMEHFRMRDQNRKDQ